MGEYEKRNPHARQIIEDMNHVCYIRIKLHSLTPWISPFYILRVFLLLNIIKNIYLYRKTTGIL